MENKDQYFLLLLKSFNIVVRSNDNKAINLNFSPLSFQIMREVQLQEHLKHKNIVEFHSFFEDDENVYIVLENCSQKVSYNFNSLKM